MIMKPSLYIRAYIVLISNKPWAETPCLSEKKQNKTKQIKKQKQETKNKKQNQKQTKPYIMSIF